MKISLKTLNLHKIYKIQQITIIKTLTQINLMMTKVRET